MLKIAAVAVVAALAGTTYVVAHANSAAPTAPVAAPAPAPSPGHRAARTARAEGFARVATTLAAVTTGARAAAAAPSLDCATVGHHMAELSLSGQPAMPTQDPAMMDQIVGEIAPHFTAACNHQHWTQEYMACILGATDMMSGGFDCAPYATGHDAPFSMADDSGAEPPNAVARPTRTDPVPPTSDTSCAGVARHVAELTEPDPAAIAALPDGQRQHVEDGIARTRASIPGQIEKGCTDASWPEERRRCLAAATTARDMGACI